MADLKISNGLFIGKEELNHFKSSLTDHGYKKYISHMIQSYGVARTIQDTAFDSLKIIPATLPNFIALNPGVAFTNDLNIIENVVLADNLINIPSDSVVRYLVISYAESVIEEGALTVDANGGVTGIGTLFTQMLRGNSKFPSKISFPSPSVNTGEYFVASVLSDTSLQLNVPANSMTPESGIKYRIIGTFTPGTVPSVGDKFPFIKNSFNLSLEATDISDGLNSFILASVSNDGVSLSITDLRNNNLFSSGALSDNEPQINNLLIGLEQIQYNSIKSDKSENLAKIGWGLKSLNGDWSFNSSLSQVTITAGVGGIWQDISSFTAGDFNDWYVYNAADGQFLKILNSVLSGPNIVLTIEFTTGLSAGDLSICPKAHFIELLITNSTSPNAIRKTIHPIHLGEAVIPIVAGISHSIYWRNIIGFKSSGWQLINSGNYSNETRFNTLGVKISATLNAYVNNNILPALNPLNHEDDKASRSLNNTFSGNNTFNTGELSIEGTIKYPPHPETINSTQNDYSVLNNRNHLVVTTTSGCAFTGFTTGVNGRRIKISNSINSTNNITLVNQSGGSIAGNRIRLPFNDNEIIYPGHHITLEYSSINSRWLVVESSLPTYSNNDWESSTELGLATVSFTGTHSGGYAHLSKFRVINGVVFFQFYFQVATPASLTQIDWVFPTALKNLIGPSTSKNNVAAPIVGSAVLHGVDIAMNTWINASTGVMTLRTSTGAASGGSGGFFMASMTFTWAK